MNPFSEPLAVPMDPFIVYFMSIMLYYLFLYAFSVRKTKYSRAPLPKWGFVVLIPGHNEESVIEETVRRAKNLPGKPHVIMIDDGSTDGTREKVLPLLDERTHIIVRRYPDAVKGKGEALNHAFQYVKQRVRKWYPDLPASHIVVTVVDADGYLDRNVLKAVAGMLQDDKSFGGVQIPVTIQNPQHSDWLLMQDIEFVGFSCFVQQARHWFSSVGLGGNGQFVKLSALNTLGEKPWTPALSEDLDLGLRLLMNGYRIGFCADGFVHQQGLTQWKALLKQRTRWTQGHYQAWKYLPQLWKSNVKWWTKLDTSLYLVLLISVWVIIVNYFFTVLTFAGVIAPYSILMEGLTDASFPIARALQIILSIGPVLLFFFTYQKYTRHRMPAHLWPFFLMVFCLYSWVWIYASIMAVYRICRKKSNWVKTEREVLAVLGKKAA